MILLSGGIFCLSSWIGINNGLQRLSKMVGWGAFLLPLLVLIVGPTEFITNSIINAIGLTTQNFLQMSLFTDPLGDGSFTRNWTVFYWLWWISYTPGVAMFVTRVSRGRKIKEVIWGLILGSTVGCWFFFGVMESYAIHQFINGVINVPQVLETLGGETAVQQVLMSLPAGKLFLAAYLGVMIIFLASHMDAVAYTMAATSTRNLKEGDDPDRALRLFLVRGDHPDSTVYLIYWRVAGNHENHCGTYSPALPRYFTGESRWLYSLAEAGLRRYPGPSS